MNFLQAMKCKLAADALERLGADYGETQVVGAIYVAAWNKAAYTVTADGVEYGPYDRADALVAIVGHMDKELRREQRDASAC